MCVTRAYSELASAASTRRHSTEFDDQLNELPSSLSNQEDNDDNDVAMPQNVSCISPDMPSCASGMSAPVNECSQLTGLDDNCLDSVLGDGIQGQMIQDNICFQELSSQSDLRKAMENEKFTPYQVEDVIQALLADHNMLSDGIKKYIRQYRFDLNIRQSAWARLQVEKNLYVLTGLLFDWLEHLRIPILSRDDLSYIVILGTHPEGCLRKLELSSQYVVEYLFRFLARIHPISRDTQLNVIKRFVASLTHQGVPIQGILKPSGFTLLGQNGKFKGCAISSIRQPLFNNDLECKGYHKLREGTHRKVMEFMAKLFDMIYEYSGSPAPSAFSELNCSQQSIGSTVEDNLEEESEAITTS
ncbi:hypothetical protein C0J52_05490 [Blattella germanica]|nr:hypothetical protein C0J52_05490 [Blattella germanica]